MTALRCTCKGGKPYCAAHQDDHAPKKTTEDLVTQIRQDAARAGYESAQVYIGETAVVVVQNPARATPRKADLEPGFYIAKIHKGSLVSEQFV